MAIIQYKVVEKIKALQEKYAEFEALYQELNPSVQHSLEETLEEQNGMHANMPGLEQSVSSLPGTMEEVAKLDGDMRIHIFEAEQALMIGDRGMALYLDEHRAKCIEAIENKDWDTVEEYLNVGFHPVMIAEHVLIEGYEATPEIYLKLINEFTETMIESGHYNYLVDATVESEIPKDHPMRPGKR